VLQKDNLIIWPINWKSLGKRMLIGAFIGFVLITLFLMSAGEPNPDWGKWWRIKPMTMVPFAGAMGGVFYYIMDPFRVQGGWKMIVANIVSVLVFIIGLWMGSVLGLNGTYWD
jgi:hypothetical protein